MLRHFRTRSSDHARVPIGTEILGGIKTESRSYAHRSRPTPTPLRSNCLRRIFHDLHVKFLAESSECLHVSALPVEMDGQNRTNTLARTRAQSLLDPIRIKVECPRIDVHEYRRSSCPHNRTGRGEEAERSSDDRISSFDAGSHQRQPKRLRSR